MSFWKRISHFTCLACHRDVELNLSSLTKRWFWKVRFCPFCGANLQATRANLEEIDEVPEEKGKPQ